MEDDQMPFGNAGFADKAERRCPCILLLDTSGSMQGGAIDQLNEGPETCPQIVVIETGEVLGRPRDKTGSDPTNEKALR